MHDCAARLQVATVGRARVSISARRQRESRKRFRFPDETLFVFVCTPAVAREE